MYFSPRSLLSTVIMCCTGISYHESIQSSCLESLQGYCYSSQVSSTKHIDCSIVTHIETSTYVYFCVCTYMCMFSIHTSVCVCAYWLCWSYMILFLGFMSFRFFLFTSSKVCSLSLASCRLCNHRVRGVCSWASVHWFCGINTMQTCQMNVPSTSGCVCDEFSLKNQAAVSVPCGGIRDTQQQQQRCGISSCCSLTSGNPIYSGVSWSLWH